MDELLGELSLSRSSSIEDLYGFELVDGVPITPPAPGPPGGEAGCGRERA